ncbi:putative IQ motif, EF-hand binding protein [Helianthus annuus]|nr:putative IQ motif, EF-hand binding protein [Helianthus annuus]
MVATKIQTAYRRHLASRALRALRGLGRLRSVIQGQSVKRQTTSTLKCMQTLARV